ncbi:MAG: Flp family type IVb pilin [bacterium]
MGMNRLMMKVLVWRAGSSEEAGQGLAEYGLILALIAAVCLGALSALGVGVANSAGFVALPAAL